MATTPGANRTADRNSEKDTVEGQQQCDLNRRSGGIYNVDVYLQCHAANRPSRMGNELSREPLRQQQSNEKAARCWRCIQLRIFGQLERIHGPLCDHLLPLEVLLSIRTAAA